MGFQLHWYTFRHHQLHHPQLCLLILLDVLGCFTCSHSFGRPNNAFSKSVHQNRYNIRVSPILSICAKDRAVNVRKIWALHNRLFCVQSDPFSRAPLTDAQLFCASVDTAGHHMSTICIQDRDCMSTGYGHLSENALTSTNILASTPVAGCSQVRSRNDGYLSTFTLVGQARVYGTDCLIAWVDFRKSRVSSKSHWPRSYKSCGGPPDFVQQNHRHFSNVNVWLTFVLQVKQLMRRAEFYKMPRLMYLLSLSRSFWILWYCLVSMKLKNPL